MINFRNQTEERIYNADLRRFERFKQFIGIGDSILKVGAGLGFQAQILNENYPGKVSILEVKNSLHPDITLPLILYDGLNIPKENNTFDVAIVNHVLHHTPSPGSSLIEISRVTKNRIIIIEEVWTTWLQKISIVFNCWYKGIKVDKKLSRIYFNSYLSEREWMKIFEENFEIEYKSYNWTKDKIIPFRIGVFVLRKNSK